MCLTIQRAPLCCNVDSVSFSRHNHQGLKLGFLGCLIRVSGSAFMVLGLAFTVLGVLITAVLGYMTGIRFRLCLLAYIVWCVTSEWLNQGSQGLSSN